MTNTIATIAAEPIEIEVDIVELSRKTVKRTEWDKEKNVLVFITENYENPEQTIQYRLYSLWPRGVKLYRLENRKRAGVGGIASDPKWDRLLQVARHILVAPLDRYREELLFAVNDILHPRG